MNHLTANVAALVGILTLPACLNLRSQHRILDNRKLVMAVIHYNGTQASALLDEGLDANLRYDQLYHPTALEKIRWGWLRLTQHKPRAFDLDPRTPTLLIIAITNGDVNGIRDFSVARLLFQFARLARSIEMTWFARLLFQFARLARSIEMTGQERKS